MNKIFKPLYPVILVILISSLVSCESLFTTNLFGDLDKLDLTNMTTREKADAVLSDPEGAIEGMSASQVNTLVSDLLVLANDSSQPDGAQMQAAAAASTVIMSFSGADDTVNNLSDMATDLSDGTLVIDSPADILSAIFSDENGNPLSVAQIEAQLNAMLDAAAALETYGSVIGDGGNPPSGVNSDELAVTAMVVGLVNILSDNGNDANDIALAITAPDPETAIDSLAGTFPDLTDMTADDGMDTLFGADLANTIESSSMVLDLLDMMNA